MRILIVEDELPLAQALAELLKKENYITDIVGDGKTGLDYALSGTYDVILLDIMLPKMDGLAVLREIRSNRISTPVMLLTAKYQISDKVAGLDLGADDYLTKPFDMDELIARIVSLIRRYTRFNGQDLTLQQLHFDGLDIDLESRSIVAINGIFELPPKEFDLLLFWAKEMG